jgi:hypothetical protein
MGLLALRNENENEKRKKIVEHGIMRILNINLVRAQQFILYYCISNRIYTSHIAIIPPKVKLKMFCVCAE